VRFGGGGVEVENGNCPSFERKKKNSCHQHTVDRDGDDLGESEAIGTLEGGDLAKGLDLEVLSAGVGSTGHGLDQLDVEVVVLGSDQGSDGATVLL
jgi:hypothetical protein